MVLTRMIERSEQLWTVMIPATKGSVYLNYWGFYRVDGLGWGAVYDVDGFMEGLWAGVCFSTGGSKGHGLGAFR